MSTPPNPWAAPEPEWLTLMRSMERSLARLADSAERATRDGLPAYEPPPRTPDQMARDEEQHLQLMAWLHR